MDKFEIISFFASMAYASSHIKSIKLHQPSGQIYSIRPTMHIILSAPMGRSKSTLIGEICDQVNKNIALRNEKLSPKLSEPEIRVITQCTGPGLIGSISKSFQFIPGSAWIYRKNMLLLDEFVTNNNFLKPALSLLESMKFTKKLGLQAVSSNEEDGELYMNVNDGTLDIKTRFAAIIGTMYNIDAGDYMKTVMAAMKTRCVPIKYDLTIKELDRIACGEPLLTLKTSHPLQDEFEVSLEDYNYIREYIKELAEDPVYARVDVANNYLRTIGDCCRAFVILEKHDKSVYKLIFDLKTRHLNCLP